MSAANPWARATRRGVKEVRDAAMRIEIARGAGLEQLRAIIAWPGTQPTVRKVAEARLRKLTPETVATKKHKKRKTGHVHYPNGLNGDNKPITLCGLVFTETWRTAQKWPQITCPACRRSAHLEFC